MLILLALTVATFLIAVAELSLVRPAAVFFSPRPGITLRGVTLTAVCSAAVPALLVALVSAQNHLFPWPGADPTTPWDIAELAIFVGGSLVVVYRLLRVSRSPSSAMDCPPSDALIFPRLLAIILGLCLCCLALDMLQTDLDMRSSALGNGVVQRHSLFDALRWDLIGIVLLHITLTAALTLGVARRVVYFKWKPLVLRVRTFQAFRGPQIVTYSVLGAIFVKVIATMPLIVLFESREAMAWENVVDPIGTFPMFFGGALLVALYAKEAEIVVNQRAQTAAKLSSDERPFEVSSTR